MHLQESGEMYLEAIYILSEGGRAVRAVDVGEYRGYSKPSVSRAVGLLKKGGYVETDEDGFLHLTHEGRAVAEKMFERHTTITELLVHLGVAREVAEEDACRIEHAISDETFAAIKRFIK
ncbi:MAG: metal-dependent transcriptional regulator [Clostridia bacterium]|nr:metal-dependent transcriptional regulator [Clostridia bacterium]